LILLLSGTTVSLAEGILRLIFVALYVSAAMAALGAIELYESAGRRRQTVLTAVQRELRRADDR